MNETHDVDVLNEGLQGEYFGITAYDASAVSSPCTGRSFVRRLESHRFRTASFRRTETRHITSHTGAID